MAAVRFHLDQHVSTVVALGLRQFGVDVTTTSEAGLQDADDDVQLAFALKESRVLVTHDYEFGERHRRGEPHAGVCYATQIKSQRRPAELLQAVHLVYACLSADEMANHVEFV
jgi:predicted nuclease of predicted toxin-antitoxin system